MKEERKAILEQFELFEKEFGQCVLSGNKAAGRRARKVSLNIEKLLRQFRKSSIQASYNKDGE